MVDLEKRYLIMGCVGTSFKGKNIGKTVEDEERNTKLIKEMIEPIFSEIPETFSGLEGIISQINETFKENGLVPIPEDRTVIFNEEEGAIEYESYIKERQVSAEIQSTIPYIKKICDRRMDPSSGSQRLGWLNSTGRYFN
jgi:hypothetical protein